MAKKLSVNIESDTIKEVAKQAGETARAYSSKEQGTQRQEIDMLSDSKLSKSIRPLAIIWLLALFTASMVASWFDLKTDDQYQQLITWALLLVLGFYFPGRDIVKTFIKRKK